MQPRTGFHASLGSVALVLFAGAASGQAVGDPGAIASEDSVAAPPQSESVSGTPEWVWQQPSAPHASARSNGIPYAPLYGTPAHWSAPPPAGWAAVDDAGVRTEPRWYGWQTLMVDGAALAMFVIGVSQESAPLAAGGLLGYALGGPAVHAGHRQPLTALGSAGLRIGLPAAGALIGPLAAGCDNSEGSLDLCGGISMAVGMLIGVAGAITIDASVLARDTIRTQPPARAVSLTPTLQLEAERQVVGVQGTF